MVGPAMDQAAIRRAVLTHRALLWGVCYRMSGCQADADDIVQDVIERALRSPPDDTERDPKPWLLRVAINASRDHLRRRKRLVYPGTWLPGPAEVTQGALATVTGPDVRYGELESATVAFLAALEALSATQRAVLILRDVLGYSSRETAEALSLSEANARTTHHRARAAMVDYDAARVELSAARLQRHRTALRALILHLSTGNIDALQALLSEDARARNDSDDEQFAARRVVRGRDKVMLFHIKTNALHARRAAESPRFALRVLNGEPALVASWPCSDPRVPGRMVVRIALDAAGHICVIDTIVATRKLVGIDFTALPPRPALRELARSIRASMIQPKLRSWAPAAAARAARALSWRIAAWLRP